MEKEILYAFSLDSLMLIIPKKRGEGYLRVPVGHHTTKESRFLEDLTERDVSGLDGYVNIEWRRDTICQSSLQEEFANRVMPKISEFYGFPAREISMQELLSLVIENLSNPRR